MKQDDYCNRQAETLCVSLRSLLNSTWIRVPTSHVIHNRVESIKGFIWYNSRVFLPCQLWIVNYYVKSLSNNLSNENIKTGAFREMIHISKIVHFGILIPVWSWRQQCFCFHYWDYLTNFWRNNWQSIIDIVERLGYWLQTKLLRNIEISQLPPLMFVP